MLQYLLSPQAKKSLVQISQYTYENYSQQHATQYLTMLRERLREAAIAPQKGLDCRDVNAGYYSFRAGKHHLYYRIQDSHIEIIDVLHQSMEPKRPS